ncbi:MAG TPA: tetratricopeptide repeat protein [Ignavibacteriaceae bacterium]|nr:tetratricopeptide repeat protein [Ignavibacteriaceae bacterium]
MLKFCPECGVKLDKEFKFCPECGFNLENVRLDTESLEDSKSKVACSNCGEENNPENIVCSGCGARLKEGSIKGPSKKQKTFQNKSSIPNNKKSKKKSPGKNVKTNIQQEEIKTLSNKTIFTILGFLAVLILLILYASGTFDSKPVITTNISNQPQNSGVDLSNLQKINELEAQVKANPNDTESLLALAHLKNDSGLYQQAIVNYRQYLEKNPKNADARVDMGVCYYNLQDYKTAISEMEEALKYKPDHQIAFLNLGIVNLAAGNLDKSKEWLQKAVKTNPGNNIASRAKELLESHAK